MAKVKNKKRSTVDNIEKKRHEKKLKKSVNPFEVHINKEKMQILGRKLKNDKGLPGVSRAKAIQKRKHTLLNEYKLQHKTNKFMDNRIGEKGNMDNEDKIMARFAAIRAKTHKKNIFNLAEDDYDDDEILTHRGQTLSEIEKFDDPRSEDEDDLLEGGSGKLESNFVSEAHFGGGLLSNIGQEGVKSHKQLIEQLIEESKKRKAEKQKTKEATLELTEKLDTEWKDLVEIVNKNNNKKVEQVEIKNKLDDYDKMLRELRFEARGTVSDRLKSEDEIAKEEKEKLEKLERERLDRMNGFIHDKNDKPKHKSADDLDDDFIYDESDNEENMLSYNEQGQSRVEVTAEINGKPVGESVESNKPTLFSINENNNSDNEEEAESESEAESEDSLADLKINENDDESEEGESDSEKPCEENKEAEASEKEEEDIIDNKVVEINKIIAKPEMEENIELTKPFVDNLPFTFKLPVSYEALMELFEDKSAVQRKIILERMIKCNHPSLSQGNKEGLGLLFVYLLQYINDLFTDIEDSENLKNSFKIFASLMPQILEVAQVNTENTHNSMVEVIKEKHQDYRKKPKKYPGFEILAYFKLIGILCSTSDYRHQIVTSCFVFMEQMLICCRVKTAQDISYGLFITSLILEYTTLSKRFLPASINYLTGLLHMAIPKNSVKLIKVILPFKPLSNQLVLLNDATDMMGLEEKFNISHLMDKEITEEFKVSVMHLTLKLLNEFKQHLENLPSSVEIFAETLNFLKLIPINKYPLELQREYKLLYDNLMEMENSRKLLYLILSEKKPKALRLYEPKIEEVYDGKRRRIQSKDKAEREKLIHKLKRESKGALREIRRDKSFLGRVKINQRIQSDKDRRDKVNKIYSEAASQQGELNALDRKRKRKK